MNPFLNDSFDSFPEKYPSLIKLSRTRVPSVIKFDYEISVQQNVLLYSFREGNYMRLTREATAFGFPHTVIYHCQYIMDCVLSQVKVEEPFLSFLSSLSLYIASSMFLSQSSLSKLDSKSGYTYKSLLVQAQCMFHQDKQWVDYCIFYVLSKCNPSITMKCPYIYCKDLLDRIAFPQFQAFAEMVIDVICSKNLSMSISPHCIAYTSIHALMKKYYGLHNGREPQPLLEIDKREYMLCLNIICQSFHQLRDVCKYMAMTQNVTQCDKNHMIPSPKNQTAAMFL